MGTAETKVLLYDVIEHSDEKLIHILYSMALEYNYQHMNISEEFLKELEDRRDKHLRGESKSYSWDEVKEQIRNKQKNGL
jgi:hypothetical protein